MACQRYCSTIYTLLVVMEISGRAIGYTAWSCAPWNGTPASPVRRHAHLCYIYTDVKMTWSAGEKYCRQHGGIFAKEESRLTNAFFRTKLLMKPDGRSAKFCYWIGLNDKGSAGNWKWSDGEKVSSEYSNWHLLSSVFGWLESRFVDCAGLCTSGSGEDGRMFWTWTEDPCFKSRPVICQFEATPTVFPPNKKQRKPKTPRNLRRKTGVLVFELPNKRGVRLTSKPDWTMTAFTTTNCARHCQGLGDRCQVFNYNSRSRECHVFSSERVTSGGGKPGQGWSTWRVEVRDTY